MGPAADMGCAARVPLSAQSGRYRTLPCVGRVLCQRFCLLSEQTELTVTLLVSIKMLFFASAVLGLARLAAAQTTMDEASATDLAVVQANFNGKSSGQQRVRC